MKRTKNYRGIRQISVIYHSFLVGVTKKESVAVSEMTPVSGVIISWGLFKLSHKHPSAQNKRLLWKTGLKYPHEILELIQYQHYTGFLCLFLIN